MSKISDWIVNGIIVPVLVCIVIFSALGAPKSVEAQTASDNHPKIEENHAADAAKWLEDFTNPMHEPNYYQTRQKAYDEFRQMDNRPAMKSLSSAAWIEVGKSQDNHASGRTSCIAFDSAGTIYLGAVSGGLWKSTDNGTNWVNLSETWKSLVVGGVAVDPKHPSVIYCGTGAPLSYVGGGGDLAGVGVYKSVDGGLNWNLLTASPVVTAISQMEVNWANTNIVYCATIDGVSLSTDSGHSWRSVLSVGGYLGTSIVLDPNNAAVIYAGSNGVIEKSIDSGKSWLQLSGYPSGALMTLAMSNVSSDTIYVTTGAGASPGQVIDSALGSSLLGLSTDAGNTWRIVSDTVNYLGQQAEYADAIAVNPRNPAIVVVGGLDIYSSNKAGTGLAKRTDWTAPNSSSNYAHADIHGLKYNPYTGQLYAMTDGGIFHSASNGLAWDQDMNVNLGTLLFVGGDFGVDDNGEPTFFSAGAQDNGTNRLTVGNTDYNMITGGDGGSVYVSPTDGQSLYATYVYASLFHSVSGGSDWVSAASFNYNFEPANILYGTPIASTNVPFYLEYDVCDQDPNVIAVCGGSSVYDPGSGDLFLSLDGGATSPNDFRQVTNISAGSAVIGGINTVHIAKNNSSYIFVGTSSGRMYYSIDQGTTWTKSNTALAGYPTSITSDPNNETHLYMTVAGSAAKHFYISTDTGRTWTSPAKNLPNSVTYHRVQVDGNGNIFVGNDFGVLRSANGGVTWYNVAEGFPYAMVTSLKVRGHYLMATTYGRGMYYIDLNQLPAISDVKPAAIANAGGVQILDLYPSILTPSSGQRVNVDYSLPDDTHATLTIYDVLGREKKVLVNEFSALGNHSFSGDLSGFTPAQYYLVLTADGFSVTKPLTIE